ncbi:MAG: hypothetical protein M0036_19095 [Desulfobacteraceae bacterium]|nr:hypothetical protein [Desulfobacteraceae bacterium]
MESTYSDFLRGNRILLQPCLCRLFFEDRQEDARPDAKAEGYEFPWGQLVETRAQGILAWDIRYKDIVEKCLETGIHPSVLEDYTVKLLERFIDQDGSIPDFFYVKGSKYLTQIKSGFGGLAITDCSKEADARLFMVNDFLPRLMPKIIRVLARLARIDTPANLFRWAITEKLTCPLSYSKEAKKCSFALDEVEKNLCGYDFQWGQIVEDDDDKIICWDFRLSQLHTFWSCIGDRRYSEMIADQFCYHLRSIQARSEMPSYIQIESRRHRTGSVTIAFPKKDSKKVREFFVECFFASLLPLIVIQINNFLVLEEKNTTAAEPLLKVA